MASQHPLLDLLNEEFGINPDELSPELKLCVARLEELQRRDAPAR